MKHGLKKATSFACCRVQGKPCCKLQDFEKRIRAQLKQHPSQPTQCYENQSDNLVKHATDISNATTATFVLTSKAFSPSCFVRKWTTHSGENQLSKQRVSRRFFHHDR